MTDSETDADDSQSASSTGVYATLRFDQSLCCLGFDEGGSNLLGITPEAVGSDILPQIFRTPEVVRSELQRVQESGRPTTIRWEASATGAVGWGWVRPANDGVSILLSVDEEAKTRNGKLEEHTTPESITARSALLEQTERLANTGGWEYDRRRETLTWTAGTKDIHGVDTGYEPTVEEALSFYHPDDRELLSSLIDRAVDEQEPYDTQARLTTTDGRQRWVRTVGEPVIDADGEVVAVRGAIRDISDERAQERQISLLKRAIDASPVGVTLADVRRDDEPLMYVNQAFEELTGYDESEVLGRNCRFLQGEETREEPVATLRAAIDAGEPATVELRNYRADGTMFWNRLTISPVTDDDGAVTHYVGFQIDVTEAKTLETQLQEFKQAVECSGHAIYITDVDGTITYVNKAFEETTGYRSEEAVGQTPNILNSGQMDDKYFDRLWSEITAGNTFEERIVDRDREGHFYRAHQTISPLIGDDGEVTGFVAVQTDITDQIERSQQVAVLDRVLRHNLRNDMNIVLGHAERLAEALDGDLADSARTIRDTGADLLDLAQKERAIVERLNAPTERTTQHLRSVIDTIVEDLEPAYPDARLTVECPAALTVSATPQVGDALGEFVENALEHTDESPPSVRITAAVRRERTGDAVRISIADRGPGVPESLRQLVTSDRVPDSLTHSDGLGMWIASWVVTRSGGSVDFETRDGGGTVVHVTLPGGLDEPGSGDNHD
ncbi:PAS domain S-box protein [Halobaculum limi]|uniref:PAS domain S-box protein n=1 Tax=Halobaculum limi TaxID=3031916 RepID=UPI0024074372|nr:PAS domain S-box protein [Halobaculum sp. YSMS11]